MITFWIAGAFFTFTYTEEPNKGWDSVLGVVLCLMVWPMILGIEVRERGH